MISFLFLIFGNDRNYFIRKISYKGDFSLSKNFIEKLIKIDGVYSKKDKFEDELILRRCKIFKEVSIQIRNTYQDSCDLIIYLNEKQTINFNFSLGKVNKRQVYHFGFSERNLFNRHILAAFYSSYEDNKLSYTIWGEVPRLFTDIDFLYQFYKHDQNENILSSSGTSEYNIKRYGFRTGLRYHFNKSLSHEFQLEYFNEEYKINGQINKSLPVSAKRNKKSLLNKTSYNNVNYDSYRIDGYELNNYFNLYGEKGFMNPFMVWYLEAKYFNSKKRTTIAVRGLSGLSSETEYLYPFSVDGLTTIRSGKKNEIRGQQISLFNGEYRYVAWDNSNFYLQTVFFVDFVYLNTNNSVSFDMSARDENTLTAIGPGFRIALKNFYSSIIRIDFPYRNDKFLINIGFGQFF